MVRLLNKENIDEKEEEEEAKFTDESKWVLK